MLPSLCDDDWDVEVCCFQTTVNKIVSTLISQYRYVTVWKVKSRMYTHCMPSSLTVLCQLRRHHRHHITSKVSKRWITQQQHFYSIKYEKVLLSTGFKLRPWPHNTSAANCLRSSHWISYIDLNQRIQFPCTNAESNLGCRVHGLFTAS